ncbi:hypothetical protein I7I48_06076 [Histoplasma ohiense]|nr:hypothetical protein I7I48_06076 [Histoplasma ohiense (nom. inval.)]
MDEAIPQSWPWNPPVRKPPLHSTSASTITPANLAVKIVRQEFCGSEPVSKIHGSFSSLCTEHRKLKSLHTPEIGFDAFAVKKGLLSNYVKASIPTHEPSPEVLGIWRFPFLF